ncbi:MAG: hypothetical protein ACI9QD_001266, partial [Thermoproteota archaeon]
MFKLRAKDFLYERMGPWPQPSPAHPHGEAPAVIHLPFGDTVDWWAHIGSRYVSTLLTKTPYALLNSTLHQGLEEVTDADFLDMLVNSLISKFILPDLDKDDLENFKELLNDSDDFYILDLAAAQVVEPYKGLYTSGTKTLLKRTNKSKYDYQVIGIYVMKTNSLIMPTDDSAWELAKYFVLQGAAMCSTLTIHPLLHFPFDSINAVTKTSLPKDHLLLKLLYPHLRFTLYLENAVLTFKTSVVQNKKWMIYAPYPGSTLSMRELIVEGFKGIKGNASYPKFSYPMKPTKVHSTYGDIQDAYYEVFYNFCKKVLKFIPKDDFYVKQWAHYLSTYVPNFPDSDKIFEGDNFIQATAYYMWAVTLGHSIDHYNYGTFNIRKIPMRLRQAAP